MSDQTRMTWNEFKAAVDAKLAATKNDGSIPVEHIRYAVPFGNLNFSFGDHEPGMQVWTDA